MVLLFGVLIFHSGPDEVSVRLPGQGLSYWSEEAGFDVCPVLPIQTYHAK